MAALNDPASRTHIAHDIDHGWMDRYRLTSHLARDHGWGDFSTWDDMSDDDLRAMHEAVPLDVRGLIPEPGEPWLPRHLRG